MAAPLPVDLESGWRQIQDEGINKLLELLDKGINRESRPFPPQKYMQIYNVCYKMCTQRTPYNFSEQLYDRHGETFRNYLSTRVLNALVSTPTLEQLLLEVRKRWINHTLMNRWMFKFFAYLDRYFVDHHNFAKLQEAGNAHFKTEVFDNIAARLTTAILEQINAERDGMQIQRDLIRSCIQVYEAMGEGNLEVYQAAYERSLLQDSERYYAAKAADWITRDNVPAYLARVEEILNQERERVRACMHESTEASLLDVLQDVLLTRQQTRLLENEGSGLRALLKEEKREDVRRLFRLYSRVGNGERSLDPIAVMVREHIQEIGANIVKEREAAAAAASGGGGGGGGAAVGAGAGAAKPERDSADKPAFVKALLELHDKAKEIVSADFMGHARFQKALKDAFEVFVNKETEASKFSNAEVIAAYTDRVLKVGGEKLNEEQLESELERIVQLFSYISDKDVFAEIYRNQLAKRILNHRSASDDSERSMISKLKLRMGAQYTSKMEGMLNDLKAAHDQSEQFKAWLSEHPAPALSKIDFAVQVLTMGWWPTFVKVDLNLPKHLSACQDVFVDYYKQTKANRKLTWLHSQGTATLKASFGKNAYELQVVTVQAVALVLFNTATGPMSFDAIREALGSDVEVVKKTLHSLSCGKVRVLTKTPESNTINPTDTFDVNAAFTSQLRRVGIPMPSLEDSHNPKAVEEDRSTAIEAAVVRIMKSRKTLTHNELVSQVITQLHFFKPVPRVIKKRIESLIDREFLERDSTDANLYKYLA